MRSLAHGVAAASGGVSVDDVPEDIVDDVFESRLDPRTVCKSLAARTSTTG